LAKICDWRDKFKYHTLRTAFILHLTRPQLEFLCAVADDCEWDRANMRIASAPHNFIASENALEKRGLIVSIRHKRKPWDGGNVYEIRACHELTPAGIKVVELLKIAGLFIQADAIIERRAARRRA
jgi:hypothetical protein